MVNEKIINDTIKRMLSSGVDEPTIISTLQDIGLEESEARGMVEKQKSGANDTPEATPNEDSTNAQSETNPASDSASSAPSAFDQIKSMKTELETQSQVRGMEDTATHHLMNEHASKLDDVGKKIDEVKKEIKKPSKKDVESNSTLENRLTEIEAKVDATRNIMEKVLEANRKILTELESKK
jgi:hypothetical protein